MTIEIRNAVSDAWRRDIRIKIKEIEFEENIQILLAVESGSRAWGFHSPDSDYDVRFIYVRPVDWHLGLHEKRDVVERPINGDWDLSGWELAKALNLALGSNAVVAEWLQSPIIYQEHPGFRAELAEFCKLALDRKSVTWHYMSLLKRQRSRSLDENGQIKLKRYFYMLRPVLALRWMRINEQAVPPMNMQNLMVGADLSANLTNALNALTERKKKLEEQGSVGAVDASLDDLINTEEHLAQDWLQNAPKQYKQDVLLQKASAMNVKYSRAVAL